VDEEDLAKYIPGEIAILQKVSHPNIIRVFQIVETERRCFFVTQIAENGNLLDYMSSRYSNVMEAEARYVFGQICSAISYCHSLGIAHRDIKLANVFFDKNMYVKVGGNHLIVLSFLQCLLKSPCFSLPMQTLDMPWSQETSCVLLQLEQSATRPLKLFFHWSLSLIPSKLIRGACKCYLLSHTIFSESYAIS